MKSVNYVVDTHRMHDHLFSVDIELNDLPVGESYIDAVLPVWTIGSYLIREFSRHVRNVVARTPENTSLP
ncbi:MAG: M61 family metallopeptidase, partial [Candidatus Ranarchaeia archaeon]